MKTIGNRISFEDKPGKTTVVIVPENNVFINVVMGAWLAMWYAIGFTVAWSLFTLSLIEQERIILYIFLVFWVYYAFRISKSFFWILYGKELIKVDSDGFYIKKSFMTYGKSILYLFNNIKDFQFEVPEARSFQSAWESSPWINGGERFSFMYFGKGKRFGRKLNEKDAQLLFNLLINKIKKHRKR
jgi:hypothetical protein